MRPELENKKGQEYFSAWDSLMLTLGPDILAMFDDLRAWLDNDLDELGLYGAICAHFDLPVKTLVQWLERQKKIPHGVYDIMFYGNPVDKVKARGQKLLDWRAAGKTYAELRDEERAAVQREIVKRQQQYLDKTFPLIDKALDREGKLIRIGDKVEIVSTRRGDADGRVVQVRELRIRAGKAVTKYDTQIFFDDNGRSGSVPTILCKVLDAFYGE